VETSLTTVFGWANPTECSGGQIDVGWLVVVRATLRDLATAVGIIIVIGRAGAGKFLRAFDLMFQLIILQCDVLLQVLLTAKIPRSRNLLLSLDLRALENGADEVDMTHGDTRSA
jgi:hypothetical protein